MKTILKPIVKLRESYEKSLQTKVQVNPKALNLALLSNPFLKDQDYYRIIQSQIAAYNKRIGEKQVTDGYEVRCMEKLFVIVCDLVNMELREDQVHQLGETWKWWCDQRRIIKQRKELGVVKYKTDKVIDRARAYRDKMNTTDIKENPQTLPNEIRFAQMFPFQMEYRSVHKEYEIPIKRLAEYKRKVININESQYMEDEVKTIKEKVNYPRPKKYEPPEETNPEQNGQVPPTQPVDIQNLEANAAVNPVNPDGTPIAEGQVDPNKPPEAAEDPNQQDLGMGLGEEPQPQEEGGAEQQTPQQDKLAPKNKIYAASIAERQQYDNRNKYSKPYLFYNGTNDQIEQRMQDRAVRKMQYSLMIQRQEKEFIKKAHVWAAEKSKIDKQLQLKMESMINKHNYSFSHEDPEKKEMLAPTDERKYGFFTAPKLVNKSEIMLDTKLPQIEFRPVEKEIRKDRLASLKHKFSALLNLRESSQIREQTSSICQVSPRPRNFSMILEEHSLQKEKYRQLEEIQKIKENLGKQRININIRTLAQALVPQSSEKSQQLFQSPPKQLPNNPFFVEVKKKKKKK